MYTKFFTVPLFLLLLSVDMKFGKNLAQHQSKYPYLRFLDYKELKKVIKLEPEIFGPLRQEAADRHFNDCLTREIEAVNICFSTRVAQIFESLTNTVSIESNIPISDSLRLVMKISEDVEVLRRFAVWNAVAVVKILKKRTKAHGKLAISTLPTSEWWLSQQLFFSGSDFAELQAALESVAARLSRERLAELSDKLSPELVPDESAEERCPICLERCVDAVELSSCGHRFCWKCVVLGPIAFAPGEYRLSRCSVCRNEQPLDPTRNFKSVVSSQLQYLSQIAQATEGNDSGDGPDPSEELELIFKSAGGAPAKSSEKNNQQAIEASVVCSLNFFCSLCCEPLLLEAITTTPCKHHFHRVCLEKYADPSCPLCDAPLPLDQVMSRFLISQMEQRFGHEWRSKICVHKSDGRPCEICGKCQVGNVHELLTTRNTDCHPKNFVLKSGIRVVSFDPKVIEKKKYLALHYPS